MGREVGESDVTASQGSEIYDKGGGGPVLCKQNCKNNILYEGPSLSPQASKIQTQGAISPPNLIPRGPKAPKFVGTEAWGPQFFEVNGITDHNSVIKSEIFVG